MKKWVFTISLSAILAFSGSMEGQDTTFTNKEVCRERNLKLKRSLDPNSSIFNGISEGVTGNGIDYPWRLRMREIGVRRIAAGVRFQFSNGALTFVEIANLSTSTKYDQFESLVNKSAASKAEILTDFKFPIYARALELLERPSVKPNSCGEVFVNLLDDACLPVLDSIPSISYKCEVELDVTPRF